MATTPNSNTTANGVVASLTADLEAIKVKIEAELHAFRVKADAAKVNIDADIKAVETKIKDEAATVEKWFITEIKTRFGWNTANTTPANTSSNTTAG